MPVTFHSAGSRAATLREYVDPQVPTLTLAQLTPEQRREIVLKRLRQRPDYPLVLVSGGPVDKKRALTEVRSGTAVGDVLTELEFRFMNRQLRYAAPRRKPRTLAGTRSK